MNEHLKEVKRLINEHNESFSSYFDYTVHEYLDKNKIIPVDNRIFKGTHKDMNIYMDVYWLEDNLYGLEYKESELACTIEYVDIYEVDVKTVSKNEYVKVKEKKVRK